MKRRLCVMVAVVLGIIFSACGSDTNVTPTGVPTVTAPVEMTPTGSVATPTPEVTAPVTPTPKPTGNAEPQYSIGSWPGSDYRSAYGFVPCKNGELLLIMTGLTEGNITYTADTMQEFDYAAGTALKLVDEAYVDAEKWDTYSENQDDDEDSNLCWASSVADLLWISGWANGKINTCTGQAFTSEDDIFRFYNNKITNRGCSVDRAFDFFFMGEYCPEWSSAHPAMYKGEPDHADGVIKNFVSTLAVKEHDLIADPLDIVTLERMNMKLSDAAVFQASIGFMMDDVVSKSQHSVAVVGVLFDESTSKEAERYKAIILADSDNDGCPDDAMLADENITEEQKNADKAARPNSYTVYPLVLSTDAEGTEYWEILDYSEDVRTILYSVTELPLPSDELLAEYRETEGTCNVIDNVDLMTGYLFTTSETERTIDPFFFDKDVIKTVFAQGEAVNLNFFLSNRGFMTFDDEYRGDADLTVVWTVTAEDGATAGNATANKAATGTIVASGTAICNDDIYTGCDMGYLVSLNEADGVIQSWAPGRYTVTVTVNTDHAIKEAYYINNLPAVCTFELQ